MVLETMNFNLTEKIKFHKSSPLTVWSNLNGRVCLKIIKNASKFRENLIFKTQSTLSSQAECKFLKETYLEAPSCNPGPI